MKFDVVIGNPPYQETRENTSDKPVYNEFMDEAYKIAENVEFITPARFLFDAGRTPKVWNQKMLNNEHFKVLSYKANSKEIFSNTDIKGGIIISFFNATKNFGKIEVFTAFTELNSIMNKLKQTPYTSLSTIMYPYSTYSLNQSLFVDFPDLKKKLSNLKIITTNIFDLLPNLFFSKQPNNEYCCILGRQNNNRTYKYIHSKYINVAENYEKYKVIIPKSNGSGALGEVFSTPLIGTPLIGYTQSFLGIGSLSTESEANALLKYISSKFARVLLGILKSTQDNPPEKWKYVPLQDFTDNSEIDWSKSIHEIDLQLYKKYGLDENEINFIETHVKEME